MPLIWFLVLSGLLTLVQGHGMLIDPVNRASRFRYDGRATPDWNDNGLNCGGYSLQHGLNGGKCGICGDSYSDRRPRAHELGGRWGDGVVVRSYKSGSQITASVRITSNHKGYFKFDLCNMDPLKASGKKMEEESCFNVPVKTVDGKETYLLPSTAARVYDVELQLPEGLTCKHCVLRWTYTTGNSWGWCGDGTGKLGCGAQETFRTCSDIEII
ncbi:uncharacterized protein LOC134837389 [Culicoides brevitarsis]|uniref:uncharacterized protein LOC134837389 n=1 Tax=Culicoides brevitarsis TaxID=469753 RepID=UPI00307B6E54